MVCSHAPRLDYLQRTLSGLRAQTLAHAAWDLLIVDNASPQPIAVGVDLSWHPRARCLLEPKLGLTNARICGIGETTAPVIVFVDDDNVLAPDYLAAAAEIGRDFPFLGAWGGSSHGVYENPPPDFCLRHAAMLAIRDVTRDAWSNTTEDFNFVPCGAGMCIRRDVALAWVEEVHARPASLQLGRIGRHLGACEDGHLALLSGRFGLGTGIFRRLSLDHLIPSERLSLDYFVRLAEGHAYSYNLLRQLLGQPLLHDRKSGSERLMAHYLNWRKDPALRAINAAMARGRAASIRDLAAREC